MLNKKFWKYFCDTLKESRWLLLKYIIVGVYLIVVGFISNRLQLKDLTYYNAMITLMFFGEMIAFGFSEGFGIYINQHINEPEKSKKYAKFGLYFTATTFLILAIFLACFPNFIITNILNLDFKVDLAFYYIMLFAMFFDTVFCYYTHVLKKVGEFKFQMLSSLVMSVLIILGMSLLLIFGNLLLIPIAFIYLSVCILCVIFCHIALIKNKTYSVNLLEFKKISLSKQEVKIVTQRALSEVVWEIGYFFISLFILKMDVIAYNQYCYFENALDILNGFFFSFVSVSSIKICRCIGEDKKDEAYYHAKQTIPATIILWLFFAIISLSFYIPLKIGMNIELQPTAFISLILYLIVSLLRFLEWNLGTYVLGQSEYFSKAGLVLETIFTSYWIILFLIANFLPVNIYLIYSLIAFENIIKTAISLIVFKQKKWILKVSD